MKEDNYKVLIVDDVEENLQVVGSILGENNIAISFAKNGRQAIKIAQRKQPDLILLDINMPEMNGDEACKALKKNELTKDIPIIFLSAFNEKSDIIKGFEYGGVDYVTKPFNKAELLSRVFTHLELKYSKDKIEKQNEQLKELNNTKDKFFSIIAHDLKNPFNNLINFSELLLRSFSKFSDEKKLLFIKSINTASNSGYKLLENLLEWSRLQTGRMKYKADSFDIKTIIDNNLTLVAATALEKSVQLNSDIKENTIVYADKNMLDTIIRNLISNALKFTDKGGEITLSANIVNSMLEISVKDTGVGISPENINKLFRIDQNYSTEGTANERGTGLGLVLCKEFVEKNGGKIWVKSEENVGSEFCFTTPMES